MNFFVTSIQEQEHKRPKNKSGFRCWFLVAEFYLLTILTNENLFELTYVAVRHTKIEKITKTI
jgi:hypothetical protein